MPFRNVPTPTLSAMLILLLLPGVAIAGQDRPSAFTVYPNVLGTSGGEMCDTLAHAYDVEFTLGETGAGRSANAGYSLWSGFRPKIRLTVLCATPAAVGETTPTKESVSFTVAPNPASGQMSITCDTLHPLAFRADVFDPAGRHVRSMATASDAPHHQLTWDGNDDAGHPVVTGLYYMLCQAGSHKDTRKVVVLH